MSKVHLSLVCLVAINSWAIRQTNPPPTHASQLFQEASRLQNAGKFAEAAGKWREFLSNHADDPALGLVYQGLGACLLETGEWQASIGALNQALKRLPQGESASTLRWNLAVALYRRAESTKTQDHRQQVERALRDVLDDQQTSKERQGLAAFYLARTELALGNKTAAKQRLDKLLQEAKATNKDLVPPVLLALAGLAEEAKDWPRAKSLYRDFLGAFQDHASADEARLGLADVLLHEGQYQEAETLFGQLVNRQGLAAADYVHFRWAESAELRGEPKAAAERWSAFLDKHPKSPLRERALRRAGQVQLQLKHFSEAAAAFSAWLEENPVNEARATTQVQLGLALMQVDKLADAEHQFKSALERLPEGEVRSQALLGMARCAVKLNRPADAVKSYDELLHAKTAPLDVQTTTLEAVAAAFAAGDSQRGLEWTDRLVEGFAKSPWTSQAQLHAARYLTENGQFDAAWQRSRWVFQAKVAEAQPPALYLAGFCAMKLRKFADAVTYYQTLRDEHPQAEQAPVAAYSLGVAFESQGATAKALAAYQAFLNRYAKHTLASEARKRVQVLQESR